MILTKKIDEKRLILIINELNDYSLDKSKDPRYSNLMPFPIKFKIGNLLFYFGT